MSSSLSGEYSDTLDNVIRELQGTEALVQPVLEFSSPEYQALLGQFKAYQKHGRVHKDVPPLRLYTCYRGVPFDAPVEVLGVDEEFVELRVTSRQAKVLACRGFAMVESPVHGAAFRAFTSDVDEVSRKASFSHFVPHYNLSDLRTHMRVEPRVPLSITLSRETSDATGQLIDLSELAIAIQFRDVDASGFTEGMTIDIRTTLPLEAGDFELETAGTIAKLAPNVLGSFSELRVIVQMLPDQKVKDVLARYIAQRQEEVYDELGPE